MKDLKSLELELANLKIVLEEALSHGSVDMVVKLRNEIKVVEKNIDERKIKDAVNDGLK